MKNLIIATLIYLVFAAIIMGGGYFILQRHPNHAQIEVAWIFGLIIPMLPAYIFVKENE